MAVDETTPVDRIARQPASRQARAVADLGEAMRDVGAGLGFDAARIDALVSHARNALLDDLAERIEKIEVACTLAAASVRGMKR